MITAFDLLQWILPVILAAFGAGFGSGFAGNTGAVAGAALGIVGGIYLGGLPWKRVARSTLRELSQKTTEELLHDLHSQRTFMPNFCLLALASRDYDITTEIPTILNLLESEHFHHRTRGWAAMLTAFPNIANALSPYSPAHSLESCRANVQRVRQTLITTT